MLLKKIYSQLQTSFKKIPQNSLSYDQGNTGNSREIKVVMLPQSKEVWSLSQVMENTKIIFYHTVCTNIS